MRPRRGGADPEADRAVAYAASNGGDATGLPRETLTRLLRLGLVEAHPFRTSSARADVHRGMRLTRRGFEAAGRPWRSGRIGFAFGGPDDGGWTLTLVVLAQGVRVALVPMRPTPNRPLHLPPFVAPAATVEEHADPADAAAALRALAARAEGMSGRTGRIRDPGYLAWDGAEVSIEDVAALDAGEGPGIEEALDRIDAALGARGPSPGR